MKYDWDNSTKEQKQLAVKHEMELVTHNGTTKDDFVNIMHFLQGTIEAQQQEMEKLRNTMIQAARSSADMLTCRQTVKHSDGAEHIETYCHGHRYGPAAFPHKYGTSDPQEYKDYCEMIDRLAAYEDSGISPEQVQEVAKAKVEGRLVVLPCMVGNMVYEPRRDRKIISVYEITEILINQYGVSFFRWNLREGIYSHLTGFPVECLGKTVFLSREAAEKALQGRHGNEPTD